MDVDESTSVDELRALHALLLYATECARGAELSNLRQAIEEAAKVAEREMRGRNLEQG